MVVVIRTVAIQILNIVIKYFCAVPAMRINFGVLRVGMLMLASCT